MSQEPNQPEKKGDKPPTRSNNPLLFTPENKELSSIHVTKMTFFKLSAEELCSYLERLLEDPAFFQDGELLEHLRVKYGFKVDPVWVHDLLFVFQFFTYWMKINPHEENLVELIFPELRAEYLREQESIERLTDRLDELLRGLHKRFNKQQRDSKNKPGMPRFSALGHDRESRLRKRSPSSDEDKDCKGCGYKAPS